MQKSDAAIRDLLLNFECQPILFIGSGISQRYFGSPTWSALLEAIFSDVPDLERGFDYFRQKYNEDLISVGTELSDIVFEWAWSSGRSKFPEKMFLSKEKKENFLKYLICEFFKSKQSSRSMIGNLFEREISALVAIKPHAIITTNYDLFLEEIFEGYQTVTGQTILRYNTNSFGEIFHIHGDVSSHSSIVITKRDYDEWTDKKKYISAKLLTYFAEHPVFIFGYGLGDPNVKAILRDIGELVADESGLIENVYQVFWHETPLGKSPPEQAVFSVDGKEYRIMAIHTNELEWVFSALRSQSALTSINLKLVRALAARTMRLIRHDIPSGSVSVNYDVLERLVGDSDGLPTILGITQIENPNQSHPYTLTQIAKRLGFDNWQAADKILNKIKRQKGFDIRSNDNRYHCRIKTGVKEKSAARKWSTEALEIMRKVKNNEDYELNP